MKLILLFIINICCAFSLVAQETTEVTDSIPPVPEKYGLRLGGDLSKLARTAFEDGYTGFELNADLRFSKRFFAAAEIGVEDRTWDEENINADFSGSYIKIGADFNAYRNWIGMQNAIFIGLRYGFSTFSANLNEYAVNTVDPTFPTDLRTDAIEFSGLNASWVELIFGVKTEIFNNLYLSINLQLKNMINEKTPEGFDNLIVPGFNRTYDFSEFGVGYGYTISYLIPILKR